MLTWLSRRGLCFACGLVASVLVICLTGILGYFSYMDNVIIREREFDQAVRFMKICNDAELAADSGLISRCEQKKDLLRKNPRLYALRDVICSILPCNSLMSPTSTDSLIESLFDLITIRGLKLIALATVAMVILTVLGIISFQRREQSVQVLPMIYPMQGGGGRTGEEAYNTSSPSVYPHYSIANQLIDQSARHRRKSLPPTDRE